jgi:hypothetical protein
MNELLYGEPKNLEQRKRGREGNFLPPPRELTPGLKTESCSA